MKYPIWLFLINNNYAWLVLAKRASHSRIADLAQVGSTSVMFSVAINPVLKLNFVKMAITG